MKKTKIVHKSVVVSLPLPPSLLLSTFDICDTQLASTAALATSSSSGRGTGVMKLKW